MVTVMMVVGSDFSVCALGTDCTDCGEESLKMRRLGVAGMNAKVDAQNRVQVAFTEEVLVYCSGTFSVMHRVTGLSPSRLMVQETIVTTSDVMLLWTLTPPICQPLFISMGNLVFLISMI